MRMSVAEILDKASILQVKMEKLPNGSKLMPQFEECVAALAHLDQEKVERFLVELFSANRMQWDANEALFGYLDKTPFTEAMTVSDALSAIKAIRVAHSHNKRRIDIKNRITLEFGQGHREEKSFACAL